MGSNRRWLYGKYTPENPSKVIGKGKTNYRSSYERRFMYWCDHFDAVKQWSYEDIIIPYVCRLDHKPHRYFIDFYVVCINPDTGNEDKFIIEVKPSIQMKPPVKKRFKSKRSFLQASSTYIVNRDKQLAAQAFCKTHGMLYRVITEKHIKCVDLLQRNILY